MFGKVQIEWLYSDVYHCEHCIIRVSVLIDEKPCILSLSKVKRVVSTQERDWAVLYMQLFVSK
jgi:hypothetical protein